MRHAPRALTALPAVLLLCLTAPLPPAVHADQSTELGKIQVTGEVLTAPKDADESSVSVITAADLRAHGITDLSGALELIAGITPTRGGDAGPASTVPGVLGSREADDFLLLVDGVPVGATTSPGFAVLDLADVQRIVVRRGPDPVIYGSAAFAGSIEIIHYPAGQSSEQVDLYTGSYGSAGADVAAALPNIGLLAQSFTATVSHLGVSDPHSHADRYQLLYRGALPLGNDSLTLDAAYLDLQQLPLSPTPVSDTGLASEVPPDSNDNPAGAHNNQYRSQFSLGYDHAFMTWDWKSIAAFTHLANPITQGFLVDGFDVPGTIPNAAGFMQDRRLNEVYLDSRFSRSFSDDFDLSLGANGVYGNGNAHSIAFEYQAPDGAAQGPMDDSYARDWRTFFGLYAQTRWRFAPAFTLDAGLRENLTHEQRYTFDAGDGADSNEQTNHRLSGTLGLAWAALDTPGFSATPYLRYTNTFQPSQFDFSPDPGDAALLQPETAHSWQLGAGGDAFQKAVDWDVSYIDVDFNNSAIARDVGGLPGFVNGGNDTYRDVDAEAHWHVTRLFQMDLGYSHSAARYDNYLTAGDSSGNVQLAGNSLPLTPVDKANLGFSYGDALGLNAAFSADWIGARYLDPANTLKAPGFVELDGKLGYGFGTWSVYLTGANLSDRRDPMAASELGDGQIYRMLGRSLQLGISRSL